MERVLSYGDIERIIFCPTGPREDKTYGIADSIREEIFEIFCNEVSQRGIPMGISRYFYQDGRSTQTTTRGVDIYMREKYGIAPYHVFGYDVIEKIPSWGDNPNLFVQQKLKKIFVSRPNFQANLSGFDNYRILELGDKNMAISSTLVREILKTRGDISHLTTPNVSQFLVEKKIQYTI